MKIQSCGLARAALLSMALIVASCSSAQSDWAKATSDNTISAYQEFLAAHPKDQHANAAQTMILQLQDDNAWSEAKRSGTTAAYQIYLQQSPEGAHAAEARDALTAIDRAAAWKTAQDADTAAYIQAFLQKYPTGLEADQAKIKLKDLTGYRVHLASERTDAKAQQMLTRLKSRLKERASSFTITADANGRSFSIDSPGMTEQEAKSACEFIRRKHDACQVVMQ